MPRRNLADAGGTAGSCGVYSRKGNIAIKDKFLNV